MRLARATTAAPGLRIARTEAVSHVEVRGPDYKGSLAGGHKTLFLFGQASEDLCRVVITEAPIDALASLRSKATAVAPSTLRPAAGWARYLGHCRRCWPGSPPSRMPSSRALPTRTWPGTETRNATPNWLPMLAVRFERLRPPEGLDFNDVLKQGRGT